MIDCDDDSELITEEWLRSIGFDNCRPCQVHGTPNANWYRDDVDLEIWEFNGSGEWLWVEYDRVPMRTRRDLRLLIEWAGMRNER